MSKRPYLLIAVAAGILVSFGGLPGYYLSLATSSLIWAILAASLNLLLGYTGLLSLGQATFFGFAAYAVGLLSVKAGINGLAVLLIGVGVAGLVAGLLGPLVLRAQGVYFMLITLAMGELFAGVALKWRTLTGGDDGMPGIARPGLPGLGPVLHDPTWFYYFVLLWFAVAMAAVSRMVRSPVGLTLVGVRENDLRMQVLGYNVWRYRYLTYVVSGLLGGLAGVLQAYHTQFVGPSYLGTLTSAKVLLMTIVGGPGTIWGPVLGSFVMVFLENIVSGFTDRWSMAVGALYILVVVLAPHGLIGKFRYRFGRR